MNAPPKRTAPGASRRGGNVVALDVWKRPLDKPTHRHNQLLPKDVIVLTAIPRGAATWSVKAISPDGNCAVLPGVHPNRLQALGAALLLAQQVRGEVVP
jgi:hypothetical protein